MAINGPQATACYGGLGTYVCRGENRVNDLEYHANCLRERLDRLEAMLPVALIEATIAVQKGERPPDLLQLAHADDDPVEEKREEETGNIIDDEDVPRVCMLQVLARKEKSLRKKIYEMEVKEERYKKALAEAGHTLGEAKTGAMNDPAVCKPECPGATNQTVNDCRVAGSSRDPVRQRIQELEASSKKIGLNLKNLHKDRAELSCQAKNLTAELRCTQKCLGQVQQRVLGSSPSRVIPIMCDPSLSDIYEKPLSCCANCKTGNGTRKLPQDPKALRTLAGQFKEAYKNAENAGFSPCVREPIRKTAERLRALSNLDPDACPCGQPIKCDSCVICSCAEWERDLEGGGGDEPPEESSSDDQESLRKGTATEKPRRAQVTSCDCGCNETSSESECPCGCAGRMAGAVEVCPCSCEQAVESSAISTSDPSTITETTIPSSEIDDSGYSQVGKGDATRHAYNTLDSSLSLCTICKSESPRTSGQNNQGIPDDQCEICRREVENESSSNAGLCKVCPCACTMCDMIENRKGSPPCQLCRPVVTEAIDSQKRSNDSVECTCSHSADVPPEIQKVCKVEQLRQGLENLKNRNHALRNILKSCGCLNQANDPSLSASPKEKVVCGCPASGNPVKQTSSGLICTVRLLESKCRTKDGMIIALADELRKGATPEQMSRILECLADPNFCRGANDFDRSELWNYLKSSSGRKPRVSGRQTCQRDLLIGLTVLFLITLSPLIHSYSLMPPFSQILTCFKYWVEEIPSNVGYLTNVMVNFARVLLEKQCFVSLLQLFGPLSTYLDSVRCFFCSMPGMQTLVMLVKIALDHLDSSCQYISALAQSLRNFQGKICRHLCGVMEYLNVVKKFILFQKTHLPSLKSAAESCGSLVTSHCSRMCPTVDFLPTKLASSFLSFLKILISHMLCLWTVIIASPSHLRGANSLLLYIVSCVIRAPTCIQIGMERSFDALKKLSCQLGIKDRVIPLISKVLSNVSYLMESCCCSGANPSNGTRTLHNSKIPLERPNLSDFIGRTTHTGVSENIDPPMLSPAVYTDLTDFTMGDRYISDLLSPTRSVFVRFMSVYVEQGLGNSESEEAANRLDTECNCPINSTNPEPPRNLTICARVSGYGLIISWLPPLSGPVAGYEVLAEGEIVCRIRTPMRTKTFVGGLDLRQLVLLEVRTISRNGLRSGTVEKLFNPARFTV